MQKGNWHEENYKKLQDLLSGPAGLAAFDFDNTLIYNDLGEACMYYITLQGMVRGDREDFWEELKHPIIAPNSIEELRRTWDKSQSEEDQQAYLQFVDRLIQIYANIAEQIGLEPAYRWTRIFFGGQTTRELKSIARHVFDYEQNREIAQVTLPSGYKMNTGIRIYSEMRELIETMLEKGWDVRIITASPEPIIQAVIHHWGLPEDAVKGMALLPDRENSELLLPIIKEPMSFGPGKVALLKLTKNSPLTFAAGDSWTDFNMLLHAKHALLIDRDIKHLNARALQSGFWLQKQFIGAAAVAE